MLMVAIIALSGTTPPGPSDFVSVYQQKPARFDTRRLTYQRHENVRPSGFQFIASAKTQFSTGKTFPNLGDKHFDVSLDVQVRYAFCRHVDDQILIALGANRAWFRPQVLRHEHVASLYEGP